MRHPSVLIFDFDNTLEEFAPYEELVERDICTRIAEKYLLDPEKVRTVFDEIKIAYANPRAIPNDYGRHVWFADLFHMFHINEPVDEWVREYWGQLFGLVRVFPGTYQVLDDLKEHYTLCILSDSDGDIIIKRRRIEHLGLTKYFDHIFTSDKVGHNKPHPRMFLQVLEHYKVAAEDCIMIGDNPRVDLATAKELGIHTIWQRQALNSITRAQEPEYIDAEIDEITELPDIIYRLIHHEEHIIQKVHKAH